MQTFLAILAVVIAVFFMAFIMLATMAFKAAGAIMKEFEKWRG